MTECDAQCNSQIEMETFAPLSKPCGVEHWLWVVTSNQKTSKIWEILLSSVNYILKNSDGDIYS